MPVGPEEFSARVAAAAGPDGRLPVPDLSMAEWDIFPFEPDGIRVKPLRPATLPEAPRVGESGSADCPACRPDVPAVWADDHWRLRTIAAGVPLAMMLQPRAHHDLADLPDDLAAELGILTVHIARHVEALPHIARCHVYRIGDGGAHLHPFFFARPEGFEQLRGSFLVAWDDLLPRPPAAERDADARAVAVALEASYGGTALD
ncbi:hypothetical protein ACXR2U_15635 [Jatrophihabitans sp. YIM 134969]